LATRSFQNGYRNIKATCAKRRFHPKPTYYTVPRALSEPSPSAQVDAVHKGDVSHRYLMHIGYIKPPCNGFTSEVEHHWSTREESRVDGNVAQRYTPSEYDRPSVPFKPDIGLRLSARRRIPLKEQSIHIKPIVYTLPGYHILQMNSIQKGPANQPPTDNDVRERPCPQYEHKMNMHVGPNQYTRDSTNE
jgi:hypothetical protein